MVDSNFINSQLSRTTTIASISITQARKLLRGVMSKITNECYTDIIFERAFSDSVLWTINEGLALFKILCDDFFVPSRTGYLGCRPYNGKKHGFL